MIRFYVLTACLSLASMTLLAQENDSPYVIFGDTTRTLDCRHADYARFDVPVVLDDGSSAMLTLDIAIHLAELKDEEGRVLATAVFISGKGSHKVKLNLEFIKFGEPYRE